MASRAYERKKAPERVRRALLDCTAQLAAEHGLAAVTIEAVSKAAGVTKGGLFHHFANKQALLKGAFADLLDQFDAAIETEMAKDPEPYGRFTRAYVEAVFTDHALGETNPSAVLSISFVADRELQKDWELWLNARIARHAETDDNELCEVVRLAADRIWFGLMATKTESSFDFTRARKTMIALTRTPA